MNALAIDPGSTTGWAVSKASGEVMLGRSGDLKLAQPARHGALFDRGHYWLDQMIDRHGVEVLVLERQPIIRGSGSLVTLGLRAVFLQIAWRRSLMVDEVPPTTWQAWAKRYGWQKVAGKHGGNEVDASGILMWWQQIRLPQVRVA